MRSFCVLNRILFISVLSVVPSSVTCDCSNGLIICTLTTFCKVVKVHQFVFPFLMVFEKLVAYHENMFEHHATSGRGPAGCSTSSCIACLVFSSGHADLLFRLRFLGLFFNSSKKILELYLSLGHYTFLPDLSSYSPNLVSLRDVTCTLSY